LTVLTPGDQIKLFYNPDNPQEINTLLLLGAFEGNIILAVALAFVAFYVWFFWLRGVMGRSGPPHDFGGDPAEALTSGTATTFRDKRIPAIDNRPGKSLGGGRGRFGKR
jgi:hypothetical protein